MMKQAKQRPVQTTLLKTPALDLSTVATTAPPENLSTHPPTRIFGLAEAPCFYPTTEQFTEPLKYIESIRPEAEKAGICKIIPPAGWKPTFALDTEVNSLEQQWRYSWLIGSDVLVITVPPEESNRGPGVGVGLKNIRSPWHDLSAPRKNDDDSFLQLLLR